MIIIKDSKDRVNGRGGSWYVGQRIWSPSMNPINELERLGQIRYFLLFTMIEGVYDSTPKLLYYVHYMNLGMDRYHP